MPFIARKVSKTKPKILNRSSFIFRIKSALTRRRVKIQNPRTILAKPETLVIKRKIGLVRRINPRVTRILIAASCFALISIAIFIVISVIRDPIYAVDNFEIIGNNSYPIDKIEKQLQPFRGQSLFLVNSQAMADAIRTNYVNLLSVQITKIYPDKVFIKITEKEVRAVLINLNGAYLIDEDSSVINILNQSKITYDQARLDLVSGFADQNSPLIRDVFLQKFITDRKIADIPKADQDKIIAAEFNFDTIPDSEKLKEYRRNLIKSI